MLIFVAGMHRSGTSATTRVLNLLGASLGQESELMDPQPDNPRGFWESRSISQFNERLLNFLGGSWDNPPSLEPGWQNNPDLASWRREAARFLEELVADGAKTHAVKDPRFSLTLPLWIGQSPKEGEVVVLPLRDPLAVCQSLLRRNGIPLERGAELWTRYVNGVLRSSDHVEIVDYEALLRRPDPIIDRLVQRLDLDQPSKQLRAEIAGFLEPALNHFDSEARIPDGLARARDLFDQLTLEHRGTPDRASLTTTSSTGSDSRRMGTLHIGGVGTDSGTIQRLLWANRSRLREAGVLYPESAGGRQHWMLALHAISSDRQINLGGLIPDGFTADPARWSAALERQLTAEVTSLDFKHVIFSTELLSTELRTTSEIQRVKDLMASLCTDVRVVMYLRRQDQVEVSRQAQAARSGAARTMTMANPETLVDKFDYDRVLGRWADVFGEEAIQPRLYEEAKAGHDLVADFLEHSGVPIERGLLSNPDSVPPNISVEAHAALVEFNRVLHQQEGISNSSELRHAFAELLVEEFQGASWRPNDAEVAAFLEPFEASNTRVARRWFGRETLFGESVGQSDPPSPPYENVAGMARVMARLALRMNRPPE